MKFFVYERCGGRAVSRLNLSWLVLSCFFAMVIPYSSIAQEQPGIRLSYDTAMKDTFFTNERLDHPWYVMLKEDGAATVFPGDDSLVDLSLPEYRARAVSGKCVISGVNEGYRYSDTSWTVLDCAVLKGDSLIMKFTFRQPPYIDVVHFILHNGKITHEFDLAPSIFLLTEKEAEEYPAHLKLTSLEMTLNQREYEKGDMLFAKIHFSLLDTWSKKPHSTYRYEGWLRCKVQ